MAKKILAVAVGSTDNRTFNNAFDPDIDKVRPYIRGLVDWLALSSSNRRSPDDEDSLGTFRLGTGSGANQYQIDYKQRPRRDISSAFGTGYDLIFCMSRTVVDAAATQYPAGSSSPKIVGVVSDPFSANYGSNVCAVSATRPQLIARGAKRFRKKLNLDKLFALTIPGYSPAELAAKWIGRNVDPRPVNPDLSDLKAVIDACSPATGQRAGLIVYPVDAFFGAGEQIVEWAENRTQDALPTFWTAPDCPATAYGGFGFQQKICGQYMASLVATIFTTGAMPDQPYITVDEKPTLRFGQNPFTGVGKGRKSGQAKGGKKRAAGSKAKASAKKR